MTAQAILVLLDLLNAIVETIVDSVELVATRISAAYPLYNEASDLALHAFSLSIQAHAYCSCWVPVREFATEEIEDLQSKLEEFSTSLALSHPQETIAAGKGLIASINFLIQIWSPFLEANMRYAKANSQETTVPIIYEQVMPFLNSSEDISTALSELNNGLIPLMDEQTRRLPLQVVDKVGELSESSFTFQIGGINLNQPNLGKLILQNIPAPDWFGPDGPGSQPDFVSDDYVRVIGHSTQGGSNRYAFSEFFKVGQGQTTIINDLTFTDIPPRKPETLNVIAGALVMTAETNQVHVTAHYADLAEIDVTSHTRYTSYRVSNQNIATVDPDGLITAHGKGMVFITAVNEGASAVLKLDVSPGDPLTTVVGRAVDVNGLPVAGATVRIFDLSVQPIMTDANGNFMSPRIPTAFGPIALSVRTIIDGKPFMASLRLTPLPGLQTQAGTLTLNPIKDQSISRFAGGWFHTVGLKSDNRLWTWGSVPQVVKCHMEGGCSGLGPHTCNSSGRDTLGLGR